MRPDLAAAALRALADALEAPALAGPSGPTYYSATALPPGAPSWRAARETAKREGIELVSVGRALVIPSADWDAWIASRRRAPAMATEASDVDELRAMGVQLRAVAGGRR